MLELDARGKFRLGATTGFDAFLSLPALPTIGFCVAAALDWALTWALVCGAGRFALRS